MEADDAATSTSLEGVKSPVAEAHSDFAHFVTKCRVGVTVLSGAAGEIENVNQVFQPDGRLAASNSPYPFKFKYPCMFPIGKM